MAALHLLARAGQLPGQLLCYLRGIDEWEVATAPHGQQHEPALGAGGGAHPPAWRRIQVAQRHLPAAAAALASRCPEYAAWRRCACAG